MESTAKLPLRVDTSSVQALHVEWLRHFEAHREVILDCSDVEMLGAAGAQLIVSFSKSLKADGLTLKLRNVSPAMNNDLATLGLLDYLMHEASHV
jgi:anti-anti-sigma factor